MEYADGNPDHQPSMGLLPAYAARAAVSPQQASDVVVPYYVQERVGGADSGGGLEFVRTLLRHKGKLCLFAIGGIVLGVLVGIPFTPVYRVSTALEVLSLNQHFINLKQTSPVATSDESYETSEEETQVQLLQSDALLDRVINKFDPGLVYIRHNPRMADPGWRKALHLTQHVALTDRQEELTNLADSLKVRATPRTRVIEVTAQSTDPQLGTDFTNTLTSEFIERAIEARLRTTEKIG